VLTWLSVWSKVQTCIWPSWCHYHSLSLASVKSRLVLPFWYWLTWVVPEKGPLNGCVCVCVCVCQTSYLNIYQTSPHQICRVGRTMAVDEWSEASFSIHHEILPVLLAKSRPKPHWVQCDLLDGGILEEMKLLCWMPGGKPVNWFDGCRRTN